MTYIPFLDGIRAFAILIVILNHLGVPGISGGFVGVDVFFVISGYLITAILSHDYLSNSKLASDEKNRYINLRVFFFKRARRILPMAVTVIVFSLITAYFLYPSEKFFNETMSAIWSSVFLANIHFSLNATDYFAANIAEKSAFQHFWSLAVEEQFYLFYPAFFLIMSRFHGLRSGRHRLYWYRRLAILLSFALALSFGFNVLRVSSSPIQTYFSTFSRIWELASGCLIGLLRYSKFPVLSQKAASKLANIGFLAVVSSSVFLTSSTAYPGFFALFPVTGTCLLILSAVHSNYNSSPIVKIFSLASIRYIGKLSYSLYLIHWPLLIFLNFKFPQLLDGLFGKVLYLISLLVLSMLSYTLIERTTRKISVPDSLYLRKSNILERIFNRLVLKISGDLLIIAVIFFSIVAIIFAVREYTPQISSPYEYKPYVYSQGNQTNSMNLVTQGSDTGTTVSADTNNFMQRFLEVRSKWQADMSDKKSIQVFNQTTMPALSQLQGSPAKIRWGWSFTTVQGTCRVTDTVGGLDNTLCNWNNGVKGSLTTVLLIGDSHATQTIPAIIKAFSNRNLKLTVFVRSGCQIGGWAYPKPTAATQECVDLWKTKIKLQFANSKFDYVIGSDWGTADDNSVNIQAKSDAVSFLSSLTQNLILFASTPKYPEFISCLSPNSDVTRCAGKRSAVLDARYSNIVTKAGGRFFDTNAFLCLAGTEVCPAIIRNKFVNVGDGSHLTNAIMTEIAEPLATFLGLN